MTYLDRNGNYYEGDPKKFGGATPCMKRPDGDYKLIADPLSDPMNCWVPKTQADLGAEKTAEAQEFSVNKKAFAALVEQIWDNSSEYQAAFPDNTPGDGTGKQKAKQDALQRYEAKL